MVFGCDVVLTAVLLGALVIAVGTCVDRPTILLSGIVLQLASFVGAVLNL